MGGIQSREKNGNFHNSVMTMVNTLCYHKHDIVIITLDRNVPFTFTVSPICVGDWNIKVEPGDKVTGALHCFVEI